MSRLLTDYGVVAVPSINPAFNRVSVRMLPGTSIADCIRNTMPDTWGPAQKQIRVTVNGHVIFPGLWERVKPKADSHVLIEVVPASSGTLRSVLTIAVAIAAVAAGQFYGPGLALSVLGPTAGAAGSIGSALVSAALSTAIVTAGSLLINSLIPIKNEKDVPVYAVSNLRNRSTPDGIIPQNYGENRVAGVYGMLPWSEAIGNDRYINALLIFSGGTNRVRAVQFGETPIERFKGVTMEIREGFPGDAKHTICNRIVIEKALNIGLLFVGPNSGPQYRTTARDVTDCSFDITFPSGLGGLREDGDKIAANVTISYRYSKVGTDVWSAPTVRDIVSDRMGTSLTRTFPIVFPERGQYVIELTRTNGDYDPPEFESNSKTKRTGRSFWTALRSFRPEYPIAYPKPLTTIALRMLGSAQLNGSIDEVNAIISSMCDVINPDTGAVTFEETNNPASLYRHQMLKVMAYPLEPDEIDEMREFYRFCRDQGLAYNRWINNDMSVLDLISEICAAGRGSPHDTGERWDVIIDRPSDMVAALLSPENTYEFSGEIAYVQFPHAFRISFQDETANYGAAERVVRWPGYDGPITITESLDLPGHTNPTQVWKEGRRRQYEVIHRSNTYKVKQDLENLTVQRGDRVLMSHELLDSNLAAGRVVAVEDVYQVGMVARLTCDVEMVEGRNYGCRWREADGQSYMRAIMTIPGIDEDIAFVGEGRLPKEGDLVFVGEYGIESIACTIQQIERMSKFTAEITMKDHAPQIQELLDADVVPVWDGRVGKPIEGQNDIPNAPTITNIISGTHALGVATTAIPYPVVVSIEMPGGSTVPLSGFEVRHRKVGMPGYTITYTPAGSTTVLLPGYAKGDNIEMSAHAISLKGTPGPYGSPNATHTVGSGDIAAPVALTVALDRAASSSGGVSVRLRMTSSVSLREGAFLVGRYRKVGDTPWIAMDRDSGDPFLVRSRELADAQNYEAQGAISTEGGGEVSAFLNASGSPILAVADASAPLAPRYISTTRTGIIVSHTFRQSASPNARTIELLRADGFGKVLADATVIPLGPYSPNQQDTYEDVFEYGYRQTWMQTKNGSGLVSPADGPKVMSKFDQAGNLTIAPNDISHTSWTKSNLDAAPPVAGGPTGPDGALATLVTEKALAGSKSILWHATGLTSGKRFRAIYGIKPSGRTRGRLDLFDPANTGIYTRVVFNLGTGTLGAVATAGAAFTGATADLVKVSADYWLLVLTSKAALTAIDTRFYFYDDAGAASYLGDTSKGMLLWACTFAAVD